MKQLTILVLLVLFSAPASAYVGPGLGLGVIGTIFGVLAAIVLALFGLLWYPMKRALSKKKANAVIDQPAGSIVDEAHTDQSEVVSTPQENLANNESNEPNAASTITDNQQADAQVRTESEAR